MNYMLQALKQAHKALAIDEVPIGAVIVRDGKVIARSYNTRNRSGDATAHAEMLAIRKACRKVGDWRLNGCTMYVTLEPCLMCLGACYNARLDGVYFGAYDTNTGGEKVQVTNTLNHVMTLEGGIMQEECSQLLKDYFQSKRKKGKEQELVKSE